MRLVSELLARASRRARSAAVILASMAIILTLIPATAYASTTWTLNDSIEPATQNLWSGDGVNGWGQIEYLFPRTGQQHGEVDAGYGGFGSFGRPVNLGIASGNCSATIYLDADVLHSPTTFNIEIIAPATWTYIALRTVNVARHATSSGLDYQPVTISWPIHQTNVYFRISVLGTAPGDVVFADLDDLHMSCTT